MEKWEAEMRQAEDEGDALLVMETALIEIDRLRQQLAAVREEAAHLRKQYAGCHAGRLQWIAMARAAEARAEAAEAALDKLEMQAKATAACGMTAFATLVETAGHRAEAVKRAEAAEARAEADAKTLYSIALELDAPATPENIEALRVRAEAAEAVLMDSSNLYRETAADLAKRDAEIAVLRRVAGAACKVRAQFDGVQDWSWATKGISYAMAGLWDALAALDAAKEKQT